MEITKKQLENFVALAMNLALDKPELLKKESDKKRILNWFVENATKELTNNS